MARFELAYGGTTVPVDVPDRNLAGVLEPRPISKIDLAAAFDAAWEDPAGGIDLMERLVPGARLALVVTDHTRATPTKRILPLLWAKIRDRVSASDVTVVVATGTHRNPTDDELERMLGDWRRIFRVEIHDCDGDLVEVGRSSRGTAIRIQRTVAQADAVVTIGHVGMHYYAGYTGGRKNILPGVAGRRTIEENHARMADARSDACLYDGNPVSEEMVEAAAMVRLAFGIDVVLDAENDVVGLFIGASEAAHERARAFWDRHFRVSIERSADLVIASAGGCPKDINLYQAHKAQYAAARAVRDGGVLFLLAACPDGIGHPVFEEWIERSGSPAGVLDLFAREGFRLGGHKAVYLARDLLRIDVHLLSKLPPERVRRFFFHPVSDAAEPLTLARRRFGDDLRVLVIPHAYDVLPGVAS